MEPGSQLDVFRLSKDPSKWSSKHLIGLRIEERNDIHGTRIVDDSFEDENQGWYSPHNFYMALHAHHGLIRIRIACIGILQTHERWDCTELAYTQG